MAKLKILEYPDPRLRTKATPVEAVDDGIRRLIDGMLETMYEASGIGLAATQVDVHKRLIVTDISHDRSEPHVFVNPVIVSKIGVEETEEGCLSVPGIFDRVERAEVVRVRALNRDGEEFELEIQGLLAVCVQHEIDHLDGKLFVDYLSELKRQRIRKRLEKERKTRIAEQKVGSHSAPAI